MTALLSPAWFEQVAAAAGSPHQPSPAAAGQTAEPGAGMVVQVVVTEPGAPEVPWWWAGGPVATVGPGRRADAVVTIVVELADLRRVLAGELALSVGYMQGRVKVDGPTAAVLQVLACSASDRFAVVRQAVQAVTDGDGGGPGA